MKVTMSMKQYRKLTKKKIAQKVKKEELDYWRERYDSANRDRLTMIDKCNDFIQYICDKHGEDFNDLFRRFHHCDYTEKDEEGYDSYLQEKTCEDCQENGNDVIVDENGKTYCRCENCDNISVEI